MQPRATLSNAGGSSQRFLGTVFDAPHPDTRMDEFVNISVSVALGSPEEREAATEAADMLVSRFNTDAQRKGSRHRATHWRTMTSVVRTLALCLDEVKDVTVEDTAA